MEQRDIFLFFNRTEQAKMFFVHIYAVSMWTARYLWIS